jgi:hypothetical protein
VGYKIPEGNKWKANFLPSTQIVCPDGGYNIRKSLASHVRDSKVSREPF